jgi:hypothetical protein
MPIYEITTNAIHPLEETSFMSAGIRERSDLQRLLLDSISVIDRDVMVITEEFGEWEDSRRRIDLLGLDRTGNLVVIELKRTEDGGHMELQAIRYAAMVSTMTFAKVVSVHADYLKVHGKDGDAEAAILDFLGWDEPNQEEFAQDVRIILASAEFSKELTTSVMWLNQRDMDIRCIRLKPYRLGERILLDVQQIVPLPEASDYQVRIREKAVEQRQARQQQTNRDLTRYNLTVEGAVYQNLPKRRLIYQVVRAMIEKGTTPEELLPLLPGSNRWLVVEGDCTEDDFHLKAEIVRNQRGALYEPRRYFNSDEELFRINGKTYALTKMWGRGTIPAMEAIKLKYPEVQIDYGEAV